MGLAIPRRKKQTLTVRKITIREIYIIITGI